jgi:hypothetical protein
MTTWIRLALLLAVALATACDVNKYCLDCDVVDAAAADAAVVGDGGDGGSVIDAGGADACIPMGAEVCNGTDDDCDGVIDEDVAEVGTVCGTDVGECVRGTWECTGGELLCTGTAVLPAPESCNGLDDDCDGMTDEGDPGGGQVCGTDVGECQRGVTACMGGAIECLGEIPPAPELCNARDDDCDGMFDEGNPEGGASCGQSMGTCMPGTEMCIGGSVVCVGGDGPSFELCDGVDNDCDGEIDEDYDLMNDPTRCGSCTNECTVANGQAGCSAGQCTVAYCFTGHWDLDGDYGNGCEYECDFSGQEVCDGRDNDCDGLIDEGLDAAPPAICNQIGECAGTVATCDGANGWICPYGPTVSTDANGDIIPETDCDGLDNDCDGVPDDAFPTLGNACTRGIGACQTTGNIVCNGSQDGVTCDAATPPPGTAEACNGLDDDCDGTIDENAPDDWVQVSGNLWIHQYEASRPDADETTQGVMDHRACSKPDALPWTNITQPQAEILCQTVGARLCSESEWQQACRSSSGSCAWSYDSSCTTYQADTCNGNDYDFDPATPGDQDGLLPTRFLSLCHANWAGGGIFDMSGNVKEWTAERSAGVNPLRGGSYNNTAVGISCTFDFVVADDTFQFENVGFRCCRSSAP